MRKRYSIFISSATVEVEDNEHPRCKAIKWLCGHGWHVRKDDVMILKIQKISC